MSARHLHAVVYGAISGILLLVGLRHVGAGSPNWFYDAVAATWFAWRSGHVD